MSENQLELEIKDFRAIQEARIALNGITVISGENGCGKSTISKLMYYSVKAINEYEEIVCKPLFFLLENINDAFARISYNILAVQGKRSNRVPIHSLPESFLKRKNLDKSLLLIQENGAILQNIYVPMIQQISEKEISHINRDRFLLLTLLGISIDKGDEWSLIIDKILTLASTEAKRTLNYIENRSISTFEISVSHSFNNENLTNRFNLFEYSVCLTNTNSGQLLNINTISKILYIDTPMAVGLQETNIQHWDDLNNALKNNNRTTSSNTLRASYLLANEVLNGETEIDKNSVLQRFIYRRKDGLVVDLLDCATGIKSFAILQMLVKNGYLDNKTLLIIDEPEAHLHPQWIVEYARIITLLNKELGVKFLIASHNPDMISALKYITEKEEVSGNLNFYLAEKGENDMYIYKGLGTEIDEIFSSFNIAIDRINQYGTLNDEVF